MDAQYVEVGGKSHLVLELGAFLFSVIHYRKGQTFFALFIGFYGT